MEATTKLQAGDVLSHLGRDYIIEGTASYKLAGKVYRLVRVVDGDAVLWVEPLMDEIDDRLLVFSEVTDLDITTPPPSNISYRGNTFVPRFSGRATVEVSGKLAGFPTGSWDVWRYRAAGDLFLQVEARPSGTAVLYGESVHKGMIDVLPGR